MNNEGLNEEFVNNSKELFFDFFKPVLVFNELFGERLGEAVLAFNGIFTHYLRAIGKNTKYIAKGVFCTAINLGCNVLLVLQERIRGN